MSIYEEYLKSKPTVSNTPSGGGLYAKYLEEKNPKPSLLSKVGTAIKDVFTPKSSADTTKVMESGQKIGLFQKPVVDVLNPSTGGLYEKFQADKEKNTKTILDRAKDGYDAVKQTASYMVQNPKDVAKTTLKATGEFAESAVESMDNFFIDLGNAVINHTVAPVVSKIVGQKVESKDNTFKHDVAPGYEGANMAGNIVGGSVPYILGGEVAAPLYTAVAKSSPVIKTVGTLLLNTIVPSAIQQVPPLQPGESRYERFMKEIPSNLLSFGIGSLIPQKSLSALYTGLTQYGIGMQQGKDNIDNLTNAAISSIFMLAGHKADKEESIQEIEAKAKKIASVDLGDKPHPQDVVTKKTAEEFIKLSPKEKTVFVDQAKSLIKKANSTITPEQVVDSHIQTAQQVLDNPDTKVILGEHPKQYLNEVQTEIVSGLKGTLGKDFRAQAEAVQSLKPENYGSLEEFSTAIHNVIKPEVPAVQPKVEPVAKEIIPKFGFVAPKIKRTPTEQIKANMENATPVVEPKPEIKKEPTSNPSETRGKLEVTSKYKNTEDFIKKNKLDPNSVLVKDSNNFIVESSNGNNALLTELPIDSFGKPKFTTLNQDKYSPGRKIKDPIEAILDNGKLTITDGANRFTQAMANKDKTIPVIIENKDGTVPSNSQIAKLLKQEQTRKNPLFKPSNKENTVLAEPNIQEKIPLKPIGTGDRMVSGVAKSLEAKAIEEKLTRGFGDLPGYDKLNMKEQSKLATDFVRNNPEKAINIAMGKENPPADIIPESILLAVNENALKTGNIDLVRKLATQSALTGEATAMGQRIAAYAQLDPESPFSAIRKITKVREKNIEKKLNGKKISEATKETVKDIKKSVEKRKPKKQDWGSFIESIKC